MNLDQYPAGFQQWVQTPEFRNRFGPFDPENLGWYLTEYMTPTVNGQKLFSPLDQTPLDQANPEAVAMARAAPGGIQILPDGRYASDLATANAWGRQNAASGDFMQNLLNGPMALALPLLAGGAIALGGAGAAAAPAAGSVAPSSLFAPVDTGLGSFQIGTDSLLGGGTGTAAGTAAGSAGGGGMFDFLNPGFNVLDPSTWYGAGADMTIPGYNPSILDPGYTQGNFLNPTLNSPDLGAPYQPGFNLLDPSTYGGSGGGLNLSNLSSLRNLIGGNGGTGGGSINDGQGFLSSLLGTAAGAIPPALIGNWAMNQKPDLSRLYSTYDASAANALPFIQASQTPLREAQAMGYGDLLQSQAARGIRGSSFGDRDIGQYLNTTNRGISNAGINAAQAALGLQGTLASAIPNAQANSLKAIAPILGGSLAGIGQGLRSDSANNLTNYFSKFFPNLFAAG